MHAETQINNISVIFPASPENVCNIMVPLARLNYFTFSTWIERRLTLTVQQPTAGNEFLRVRRLVELNHAIVISIIPNRFVRMTLFILQLEVMPSHYEP
jgi:hypothetical protein